MSRDEGLFSFLISIIMSFLINLIIGLVAALFAFAYELYHLAWEYQTSLVRHGSWPSDVCGFCGAFGRAKELRLNVRPLPIPISFLPVARSAVLHCRHAWRLGHCCLLRGSHVRLRLPRPGQETQQICKYTSPLSHFSFFLSLHVVLVSLVARAT